jgi:transposase
MTTAACCGVVARAHGRRQHLLHDAPFGHRQVVVVWRKRVWRCDEPACPTGTWTEVHALAEPRPVLTNRAIGWATDALAADDTTVSALARRAGVGWHTLWRPVAREAARRAADPNRLCGVAVLGVDEHVWRPGRWGGRDATCMVDLTRAEDGLLRARLLDPVPGRSGTVYRRWLEEQTPDFRAGVSRAARRGRRVRRVLVERPARWSSPPPGGDPIRRRSGCSAWTRPWPGRCAGSSVPPAGAGRSRG